MREYHNKREPLIVTKPFKFLGRLYEKGAVFDRRKIRIRFRRVFGLVQDGYLVFAKSMPKKELNKLGYMYVRRPGFTFPLVKVEDYYKKFPEEKPKTKPKKDNSKNEDNKVKEAAKPLNKEE